MNVARQPDRWTPKPAALPPPENEQLTRIEASLNRIEKLLDEFCGVMLNSKFRYGKPTDRWARR
jgi:hypothetical protein